MREGPNNYGNIFQINTSGAGYRVLYSFGGLTDGYYPSTYCAYAVAPRLLYGMTSLGGDGACGTIFQINTDGTGYQILHNFGYLDFEAFPHGSLTLSGSTLYGMANAGATMTTGLFSR